jgi:hypothetical protein
VKYISFLNPAIGTSEDLIIQGMQEDLRGPNIVTQVKYISTLNPVRYRSGSIHSG